MFNPTISSSEMPSRCLTSARSEFPWAAISILLPAFSSGTSRWCQKGRNLSTVSRRHSVKGSSSPVSPA